jgi:hypothetical protein
MSTTPRTDAAVKITIGAGFNAVCPNFARKLETELAAMQARAEKAEASAKLWEADALQRANNTEFWKARAEKTEAAMDTMATELGKMFLSAAERAYLNVELRRRAEKAEAELDRLRAEVENLKTDLFLALRQVNIPAGFWGRAASRYKARAEKAEADTARLDWLGKSSYAKFYEGPCVWRINGDEKTNGDTLREAIDAAMKEDSK